MNRVEFVGCRMTGMQAPESQCSFPGAEFYKCSFSDTDLRASRLEGIKMHTQDWRGATIDSQQLSELAAALAASWGLKIDDSPV